VGTFSTLVAIAGVHALALISPGPNVIAVSHAAVSQSRRAGVAVAAGVSVGALIWSAAAALGLAVLLTQASGLATALKIAGGAFLIVLGISHLGHRGDAGHGDEAKVAPPSTRRLIARGLAVNLTNPKSIFFFASVFAGLLPPDAGAGVRIAAVAVIVVNAAVWHTALAVALSTRRSRRAYTASQRVVRRIAGGLFVLFGLRLAWSARGTAP
jgi:threonine efflux protein